MSKRFLNDHSVRKVVVRKILSITAGKFHCWCESNVGKIRKENKNVSKHLWDLFQRGGVVDKIN